MNPSLNHRHHPGHPTSLLMFWIGTCLVAATLFLPGWFQTRRHWGLPLTHRDWDADWATLDSAGKVVFFGSLVTIVLLIGYRAWLSRSQVANQVAAVCGLGGLVSVVGAAYFVSEIPRGATMQWAFPIYLQGATLVLLASIWPVLPIPTRHSHRGRPIAAGSQKSCMATIGRYRLRKIVTFWPSCADLIVGSGRPSRGMTSATRPRFKSGGYAN